jgi:hypothetical protein
LLFSYPAVAVDELYGAKFLKNYSPQLILPESEDDEPEVSMTTRLSSSKTIFFL